MEKIIIPALDEERMQEVRAGFAKLDKPAANLGKLEDMVVGLAGMLGKDLPDKLKTAMVLMCGDHGIAKYGVSAYPQEVTRQMINAICAVLPVLPCWHVMRTPMFSSAM